MFFGIFQQNDAEKDVDAVRGLAPLIRVRATRRVEECATGRSASIASRTRTRSGRRSQGTHPKLYMRTRLMLFLSILHTNFAHGWDVIAIDMFKRIGNPRAIVTTYPASYSATEHSERWKVLDEKGPCVECRKVDDQANVDVPVLSSRQMSICRTRRVAVGPDDVFKHDVNRCSGPLKQHWFLSWRPGLIFCVWKAHSRGTLRRALGVPSSTARRRRSRSGRGRTAPCVEINQGTSMAWGARSRPCHPDRDIVSHLYIPNKSPLRPVFWTQDWGQRARVQFWTMLRINDVLGLHDLLDYWVNATLLDTRDATIYGLGTRRRAVDYWSSWASRPTATASVVAGPDQDQDLDDGPARVPRRRAGLAQRLFKIRRRPTHEAMAEATVGRQLRQAAPSLMPVLC